MNTLRMSVGVEKPSPAKARLDRWRLVNAAGKDEGMALGNTLGTREAGGG